MQLATKMGYTLDAILCPSCNSGVAMNDNLARGTAACMQNITSRLFQPTGTSNIPVAVGPRLAWNELPAAAVQALGLASLGPSEAQARWLFGVEKKAGAARLYLSLGFEQHVMSIERMVELYKVDESLAVAWLYPPTELPRAWRAHASQIAYLSQSNTPPRACCMTSQIILHMNQPQQCGVRMTLCHVIRGPTDSIFLAEYRPLYLPPSTQHTAAAGGIPWLAAGSANDPAWIDLDVIPYIECEQEVLTAMLG